MFQYGNITFRAVDENDLKLLYNMRMDEEINNSLFTLYPISMFNQKEWLKKMLESQSSKVFMVDYTNNKIEELKEQFYDFSLENSIQTIGCVRLNNIDFINRKVEVGSDLIKNFRGLGLGKKVYKALLDYCFKEMGMHQVYLYVLENNERAKRCYEAVGFKHICTLKDWVWKNDSYQNVILYSLVKD